MSRLLAVSGAVVLLAAPLATAAEVWRSTFDSDVDGVVNVRDDNPNKVMIGANTGGRQEIVTMGWGDTVSDKAGRPLGADVNAESSFGAVYKWHYTGYESNAANGVEEFAGFGSTTTPHCTRQFLGARFQHYVDSTTGEYYLRFGAGWASVGYTYSGVDWAPPVSLGAALPVGKELQLAIGYDGPNKMLTTSLYDGGGNLLAQASNDIRFSGNLGFPPDSNEVTNEVNNLSLSHLGWSDFISGSANRTHTWAVDHLAYFNDATGAFAAVVPEPGMALLSGAGLLLAARRRRSR